MKKALLFLSLFISYFCHAQKYGNTWYFSDMTGLDFNNCLTTLLSDGKTPPSEGCATICDTSGHLLFYTNSDTVWNKQHTPMPNGKLISSNGTLSQVLIVPKPTSSMYYVITTQIQGQASLNLQYHIVDMSLNGGLGNVISKNNILTTTTITEQVAATYHNNGTDVWVMVHEYGSNNFYTFLITASGINPTPVVSGTGPSIVPCSSGINARGEIKFSPDGKKIAFNNNGIGNNPNSDYLCLFDFDNTTGLVSNPINLAYERGGFGLSFSPDNTKLYGSTWKAFMFSAADSNKVFQFDITGGDSLSISNSKTILYSTPLTSSLPFGSLKIGPDGKIYVAQANSGYLGVINAPNSAGVSCNYNPNGLYLGGKTCRTGLNNYIEYQTYCVGNGNEEFSKISLLNVFPNPTTGHFCINSIIEYQNISVYNSLGELIYKNKNPSQNQQINLSNQQPGIYFCKVRFDSGEKIMKIIKID